MLSSSLAPELVSEILSQLPVKSLLRFRSVSKSYDSLISSSSFISKHLDRASEIGNESFILGIRFRGSDVILPTLSGKDSSVPIPDLCLHRVNKYDRLRLVGSCNGLVCLTKMRKGSVNFLWNPATRELAALPISPVEKRTWSDLVFGYGGSDYKLLRFNSHPGRYDSKYPNAVHPVSPDAIGFSVLDLYAKSTNSWREIRTNVRFDLKLRDHHSPAPFLNGAFHWYDECNQSIVSFHIGDETFTTMPAMDFTWSEGIQYWWVLDSMNGSLAMITSPMDADSWAMDGTPAPRNYCTVWLMHDYGVDGYWTKQFCVELFPTCAVPVGVLNGFELLIRTINEKNEFISCKLDRNEMTTLSVDLKDMSNGVCRYFESLVRIHP